MSHPYDPSKTEAKWQKKWEKENLHAVDLSKADDPFYAAIMFPYPSGAALHVGHWYQYGPTDSYARFMKMRGKDVFFPMGFDAFGLPAENYAIKTGVPPAESTAKNVETMIVQMKRMGTMYDWTKSLNTAEPGYYRWTQWLFLKMHEKGLAYRKEANVNYCSSCQTVLANEQAQDGTCERCGTQVIQKPLTQWFWKITDYAQRLLDGLDGLDWPEKTKLMQRNWIGRSEGAEVTFDLDGHDEKIRVFTTRPDTLHGATYMVLAPEHPLVDVITPKAKRKAVDAYRKKVAKRTEMERTDLNKEKSGVDTGACAINPATGGKIPVWIADYVLMNYGTGAIMAVPGHDERDYEFAVKHELPLKIVVKAEVAEYLVVEKSLPPERIGEMAQFGTVRIEKEDKAWGKFYRVSVEGEREPEFVRFLERYLLETSADGGAWYADSTGTTNVVVLPGKKFDVSTPEGMEACKAYGRGLGIPETQLDFDWKVFPGNGIAVHSGPLDGLPTSQAKKRMISWLEDEGRGRGVVNFRLRDWLISRQRYWGAPIPIVYDPDGKPHPVPEKHLPWTLPTDVEFKPTGKSPLTESEEFVRRTEEIFGKGWTPEYDTMDTFVCSSFYFLRYLMAGDDKTFVDHGLERKWMPVSMYIGGPEHACMHLIYARFVMMALKDMGLVSHDEPFKRLVHQGLITNQGAKMSKSKGNVVSPDAFVERHGADVFRMYLMFMGPYTDGGDWSDTGIKGVDRFAQRIYKAITEKTNKKIVQENAVVVSVLHKTIKSVTESMEGLRFNTAISALMELVNFLDKQPEFSLETGRTIALLLGPLAPHLADELWEHLGGESFVLTQKWPSYDPAYLKESTLTIAVQVNGKLRGEVEVDAEASPEDVLKAARAQENVAKHLEGKAVKKEIYVKGKLVSFVV